MKATASKDGTKRMRRLLFFFVFLIALLATIAIRLWPELSGPKKFDPAFYLPSPLDLAALPTATRFDFPLGNENGAFAYNAQPFTQNRHLGDDLNGIGGENSDFGDPIFAVADGRVLLARDAGRGWGNVVIILHAYVENGARKYVQSYYAHMDTMMVSAGDDVQRGQQIATVGNANGQYLAHLHFEMREFLTPFIGPGYRQDTRGWINPSEFIAKHRGADVDDVGRLPLD